MFRGSARSLFVCLLVLFSIASAHAMPASSISGTVRLPGHVLPALAKATLVPSKPESNAQLITLTIVLKRDDQTGFDRYLREIYDPNSKYFRHYLSQDQIADRFGPSQQDYFSVLDYMRANGFELVRGSANRLTLTVRGKRIDAEHTFGARIADYRIGSDAFYANQAEPKLPAQLAARVETITGLSNLARPHRAVKALRHAICAIIGGFCTLAGQLNQTKLDACHAASEAGNTYDTWYEICSGATPSPTPIFERQDASRSIGVPASPAKAVPAVSTPWSSVDGRGQTIGLLEFDSFVKSDVVNSLAFFGQPATLINKLSKVDVNGGVPTPGPDQQEVLLDIAATLGIAPGAQTVVYDAHFDGGASFEALVNQMINDKVTIISNSWAYCEDQTTLADVQGIDTVFKNAAMAGITVFNGSGDNGSTCLDGAPNTLAVPADSPNATAVGGSSQNPGPSSTYTTETWWDDSKATPPAGMGGFGVSKFFSTPSYQIGLTGTMRSVPDIVVNADPSFGIELCQESAGGCPTGLLYGGTSFAAPAWAAFSARLNQAHGVNLGFLNPSIYPLANTDAFHNAAALSSDFAHVGLGSPNLDVLHLMLGGQLAGTPDAMTSSLALSINTPADGMVPTGISDDGKTTGTVTVFLRDANGDYVGGKTVTLHGTGAVQITPPSGVTSLDQGKVNFQVTDDTAENVTFTGTDTTDGVAITQQLPVGFVVASATAASIEAAPPSVNNDGKAQTTITVTLKDTLGRPTPGKLIDLTQTGSSVISGPSPQVTDASGNIQFFATDLVNETVTYNAVDVTDGNLPIPNSPSVTFTGSASNNCGSGLPPSAPGFVVTPYATGILPQNISTGDVNFGCIGAAGLAFDASGNLYVNEFPSGNIYKFPPGGGVAGPSTLLNSTSLGITLSGLAFDGSGNLFASRDVTTGNFTTGAVMQINPSTGAVTRTISAGLTCPTTISIDPLSGDLFTSDTCTGAGSDNPGIFRVSTPGGMSPSTSVYTNLPSTPNATVAFAPGGTIYAWAFLQGEGVPRLAKVSGTNGPMTPTVDVLPGLQLGALGLLVGGTGAGTFLIANPFVNNASLGIDNVDLTTNPPTPGTVFAKNGAANFMTFGPDGCIYGSHLDTVFKITAADGSCNYASSLASPTLVLSPTSVSPNPAQGTSQTFDAMIHYASVSAGTQVVFSISGANPQNIAVNTDANGLASLNYIGVRTGQDTITASATVGETVLTSNQALVTWGPGSHTTFLSLNQSPTTGTTAQTANLVASLIDVSADPVAALSGQMIAFSVGGSNCSASSNPSGVAACQVTLGPPGTSTLTATFGGNADLLPSTASQGFNVLAPAVASPTPTSVTVTPTLTPTATATPTATFTATATATSTLTPMPTATATATSTTSPTVTPTVTPTATPTAGGDATLIKKGSGGGKPGATVDLGSFGYAASDASEQIVSSVSVSVSKPAVFSSLTLTASLKGEQIGTSTVDSPGITSTTVFTFAPPLTLPTGQGESLTFALSGVISGHQAGQLDLPNQMKLASVISVGNSQVGGFGGTGNLVFALSLLGIAMFPLSTGTRRRTSILVAVMLTLATGLVGCGGGSSGGGTPPAAPSSRQKVVALSVTENGNHVGVSGLPIDLGKITKQ